MTSLLLQKRIWMSWCNIRKFTSLHQTWKKWFSVRDLHFKLEIFPSYFAAKTMPKNDNFDCYSLPFNMIAMMKYFDSMMFKEFFLEFSLEFTWLDCEHGSLFSIHDGGVWCLCRKDGECRLTLHRIMHAGVCQAYPS